MAAKETRAGRGKATKTAGREFSGSGEEPKLTGVPLAEYVIAFTNAQREMRERAKLIAQGKLSADVLSDAPEKEVDAALRRIDK